MMRISLLQRRRLRRSALAMLCSLVGSGAMASTRSHDSEASMPLRSEQLCMAVQEVTSGDLELLRSLRPEHPRLVAREPDLQRLRQLLSSDPLAQQWCRLLKAQAD